jgi:DNA-binding SARP family transcriptional activator
MTLRIVTFGTLCVRGERGTLAGAAAQPRRLALLALLARAGDRGVTREKLTALVWPDADDERARRAITQSIYALRQELGSDDAITGVKDIRLNPELDRDRRRRLQPRFERDRMEDAVALYGPFLDGFHVAGNDEFDRWADSERTVLFREYLDALEKLATAAEGRADPTAAAGWWRRLSAKDPLSARCHRRHAVLVATGDKHGALEHARVHETLLEEQLDLPADRDVVAFAARIRRELRAGARAEAELQAAEASVAVDEPTDAPAPDPADDDQDSAPPNDVILKSTLERTALPAPPRRIEARVITDAVPVFAPSAPSAPPDHRRRRWTQVGIAAAVIAVVAAGTVALRGRRAQAAKDDAPVVAVGRITDYSRHPIGVTGLRSRTFSRTWPASRGCAL